MEYILGLGTGLVLGIGLTLGVAKFRNLFQELRGQTTPGRSAATQTSDRRKGPSCGQDAL